MLVSDNWVVQNLENALETWNQKLTEIWQLITQSPEQFKGGRTLICRRNGKTGKKKRGYV